MNARCAFSNPACNPAWFYSQDRRIRPQQAIHRYFGERCILLPSRGSDKDQKGTRRKTLAAPATVNDVISLLSHWAFAWEGSEISGACRPSLARRPAS